VAGSNLSPENVHWNQNEENSAKYKMNIESATYAPSAAGVTTSKGLVTVKYFLSDPTNGNTAYNLTEGCVSPTSCANTTKFGNLIFRLAYQNMVGQPTAVTEFSAYNNGGNTATASAYKGTNDGSNHYTVDIPVPPDVPGISVAAGTARVVTIGQIKELKQLVKTNVVPRPVDVSVTPTPLVNVVVQNTFKELALTGTLNPRRVIVANEKCNVCHASLGTTSGSNTLAEAFHGGARNTVEACVVCHDANRASSTVMTNGLALNESYQFKRMIHGIHGNSKRTYPFTHGNAVQAPFCNPANTSADAKAACDATKVLDPAVINYAAEVAWPGVGINCNACHVNNSYKQDLGPLGAVVKKPTTSAAGVTPVVTERDPNNWLVISPKAASCTACHDSSKAIAHVTSFGGATFGDNTQTGVAGKARETCDDCHSSGGFKAVDTVHGQK
jgi:OmcA/MtrC family decaheme c-type cytochrome